MLIIYYLNSSFDDFKFIIIIILTTNNFFQLNLICIFYQRLRVTVCRISSFDKVYRITCYIVLDQTLKGIRCVRLDNRKVLRAPGPGTKYFERYFMSFNKIIVL